MLDYTKFLSVKNLLQRIYNNQAKEERNIIYATKIHEDNALPILSQSAININQNLKTSEIHNALNESSYNNTMTLSSANVVTERTVSRSNYRKETVLLDRINFPLTDLIVLTHLKHEYYIEFLKVDKDINSFKFSSKMNNLYKLTVKQDNEVSIKLSEKNYDLKFLNELNMKEFIWCVIHLLEKMKLESQVQVKGINYKDLEDYATKHNFETIHKLFEDNKKKERYEVEITDKELEDLGSTLKSLQIDSIISYDLENLNSKIEQFNIETKESFLQTLQGNFAADVNYFLTEITRLELGITKMNTNLDNDNDSINNIWHGIQKIEDANHRIELRNENKRSLHDFMQKLLEQLTISPSKEETLTKCRYISTSELVIVNEVLDNFVKFYKSRKKQEFKMAIIKEGQEKIKTIVELMITNFNFYINEYVKTNIFKETFLLKNLPTFNNRKISSYVNENFEKMRRNRASLNNFILDRKFFIEKLNILVNNQEDLNKLQIFKDCSIIMAKGMRDLLAAEFNRAIKLWQVFFDSELLNPQVFDIYLSSDTLLKYDAFEKIETDHVFEANKYFTTVILNCFFAADNCMEILQSFFSEDPVFLLDKNSKFYNEIEEIVTKKIYEYLSKNFNISVEKNIILGFILYAILAAVQEKISKNVLEDMILLSVQEIYENSYRIEETYISNITESNQVSSTNVVSNINHNQYNLDEVGISKISIQETKNFINKNMKTLQSFLNQFLSEQKEIISEYTVEVRRVGVLPILRKTTNFLKLLIALTNGIKQDYIVDICEDFRAKIKITLERLAHVNPKYTTIILLENTFFINKFYHSFENTNISHPRIVEFEKESFKNYEKFKLDYINEIFEYQFKEFNQYYEKFNSQYSLLQDQVKMQSNFAFNVFEKNTISFLKNLPSNVEKMGKRVIKHFSKEENLSPFIWKEVQVYLTKIVNNLDSIFKTCYAKQIDTKLTQVAIESISNFNFISFYKK